MSVKAKVVLKSRSKETGKEITTYELCYPRWIHSEFLTHRQFSRNASSSRAIPVKRMLENIRNDMAEPLHWGANKPGMQASEELTGVKLWLAKKLWRTAGRVAVQFAWLGSKLGMHKQTINRIIEPWSHITVVVTSTEWSNFFALRDHPAAQPEIRALAIAMKEADQAASVQLLGIEEWHLPYINDMDVFRVEEWRNAKRRTENEEHLFSVDDVLINMSIARCARVSYLNHDGTQTSIDDDIKLANRLVGSEPKHASPAEHQAIPDVKDENGRWCEPEYHGNFSGFCQYRKMLPNECL